MNITEQFAANIVSTDFSCFDATTIERAKMRIADSIGVFIVGANGLGNEKVRTLLTRWGGAPEATVLVHGSKLPAHNAAFMNSLMIRSYDYEAIESEAENDKTLPAHITGTTVPTMFSFGERTGASGKELLTALILGDDLAARLIAGSGFSVYDSFDNNGTSNNMAATAVAGKLLGLTNEQMVGAFGLALNMCGGTMENVFQAAWTFKQPIALSARNGIIAAEMAELGLCGVADPIMGERCFFDMFAKAPDTANLTNELGTRFFSDMVIKPWSSCHGTQYSIDAALEATGGQIFRANEIERIIIKVSPGAKGFVGHDFEFGTTFQPKGAFSLRFTVATAVLRGDVCPAFFTKEMMSDPELGIMLEKLDILDSGPKKGAIVEIYLKGGSMLSSQVEEALGHITKKPLTHQQIYDKMIRNVEYSNSILLENAKRAFELALDFDKLDTISTIVELMVEQK